jgi:hypothetical protein
MAQKPKQPFSQADVIDAAEKLEHFAKRYRDLAQVMRDKEVKTIEAGNLKSFQLALNNIRMAINRAFEAYDRELMGSGIFADARRLSDKLLEENAKYQREHTPPDPPKRTARGKP